MVLSVAGDSRRGQFTTFPHGPETQTLVFLLLSHLHRLETQKTIVSVIVSLIPGLQLRKLGYIYYVSILPHRLDTQNLDSHS